LKADEKAEGSGLNGSKHYQSSVYDHVMNGNHIDVLVCSASLKRLKYVEGHGKNE
jgi:hypothetical protein